MFCDGSACVWIPVLVVQILDSAYMYRVLNMHINNL